MSISETVMNLVVGRGFEEGPLNLDSKVKKPIPQICSGVTQATIRHVLTMNIENDYSEDYSNPFTTALLHQVAVGWRLAGKAETARTRREYLCTIKCTNPANPRGEPQYKSANTDVFGWVMACAGSKDLRSYFSDIINAARLKHTFYLCTDRVRTPNERVCAGK